MKKFIAAAVALILVITAFSSCGSPNEAETSEKTEKETTTEEATTKPAPVTTVPAETTQVTSAPVTVQPESTTKKAAEATTAPKAPASTAPSTTQPATRAPATSAQSVSGSINASNVLADETRPSGHYNNNINAYYSGNVLVCGDYGMEYFSLSANGNSAYASAVNAFAKKYPSLDISCMLVPKCATFYAPSGYRDMYENHLAFVKATYAKLDSGIKAPECLSLFNEHRGEYMFYRTDHHWTSLGAYYASAAYCRANGITPRELTEYKTVVNTGYIGSLYSFCTSPKPESLKANPDYTVGHIPAAQYSMTYTDMSKQNKTGPVINTSAQSYAGMFLCGDEPFADITTTAGTGKKLIVFKESYGNAFVPFMIDYYDEIIVIDIRHFLGSTASVIKQYGITHALIINNLQGAESLISKLSNALTS